MYTLGIFDVSMSISYVIWMFLHSSASSLILLYFLYLKHTPENTTKHTMIMIMMMTMIMMILI